MTESRNRSKEGVPSNEDVVGSLVKELETQCSDLDKEKWERKGDAAAESDISNSRPTIAKEEKLQRGVEEDDGDDYIDEVHLKDLELTYTDEDKARLREEANRFKESGNNRFKLMEYEEAASSYTEALRMCPISLEKERAVLYANRGAAKIKLGRKESAIEDCTKAVELEPGYLKAYLRRAQLYEEADKLDEALADYNNILQIDPIHREAILATKRLPNQINEKNEKLKTEMLGKLKDLGNMFLKPFGLSTDNFQMVQDQNSGGYTINFSQNPNKS